MNSAARQTAAAIEWNTKDLPMSYHFADRARWAVISVLAPSPARDALEMLPLASASTAEAIVRAALAAQPPRPSDEDESPAAERARAERRAVESLVRSLHPVDVDSAESAARAVAEADAIAAVARGETPHQVENAREAAWVAETAYQQSVQSVRAQ